MIYNVEWATENIVVTKGDTINVSFTVSLNGAAYNMTGMQLDIKIKGMDNTLIRTLSSAGGSPAITISTTTYNITTTAFTEACQLKYDVQLTNGTAISTIQKGLIIITDEIT